MNRVFDVAVVGGGIVGLAHAYTAARNGMRTLLLERNERAIGASLRNFGMVWPLGQPLGEGYERALRSRKAWCEAGRTAGFWANECGSLHVARREDEWEVLQQFCAEAAPETCRLVTAQEALALSPAANPDGLLGGMASDVEMCVDPREVLSALPSWLEAQPQVHVQYGTPVHAIESTRLSTAAGEFQAQRIVVACGSELQMLYGDILRDAKLQICKLQMLRTSPQPDGWRIGPHIAGGLTLQHYSAFSACEGIKALRDRISRETPELNQFGIHVLAAQNALGEVLLGDSHEYDATPDPFIDATIESLILRELRQLIRLPNWEISARWHGVYSKHPSAPFLDVQPEPGVRLVTGFGGGGMTLSFAVAEDYLLS